jgi:peroxisomal coenzyme A diphosphatase NUDT7
VLLTTRSKQLRTHPGQTAFPGGRVDETDKDYIETAVSILFSIVGLYGANRLYKLREANEEVGLPLVSPHIHPICLLRPYVSKYKLFVTPVVAFLDDPTIIDNLTPSPQEVDHIFDYPLAAFIDPALARHETLTPIGSEDWPYNEELYVILPLKYIAGYG